MRGRMLLFLSACFYYSGLLSLVRESTQRSWRYLVILNYHRAGGDLRRHLLYLRRHFRILHLETALQELYTPREEGLQIGDRRTPLVLTFDDGYSDNYTHAFALAREFEVPLSIFLVPGFMEKGNSFWWLDHLILHAGVEKVTLEGHCYHLNQQEGRKALAQAIDADMDRAASTAKREELLASLRKLLAVPDSAVSEEEPTALLRWAEVREMEGSEWVSFGAHTMHHPVLGYLSDPAEVQREVSECRTVLEQQLGHPVRVFAYPYGKPHQIGDFGPRAVRRAGYDWAVTTVSGYNTSSTNPYLLKRVFSDVNQHWLVIAAKTSGIWIIAARMSSIRHFFTGAYRGACNFFFFKAWFKRM
ncbi:MAG TPA: polysaccharide deacetylase family protein [Ktedonobacteraceae bacterium]